jgi:hypothetical protein
MDAQGSRAMGCDPTRGGTLARATPDKGRIQRTPLLRKF